MATPNTTYTEDSTPDPGDGGEYVRTSDGVVLLTADGDPVKTSPSSDYIFTEDSTPSTSFSED